MSATTMKAHTLASGMPGAPLVVFAHGLEDSWTSWLPLAAELKATPVPGSAVDPGWRLVALDLPWRSGNDYRWRARPAGQWLGEALDQLDAVPDVLVSHSYGANATLELLCALDPRPGRAVTLVCPLYRLPAYQVSWRLFDRARATFAQHIRDSIRARMGGRADTMKPELLATMMDMALDRVGPSGFLTVFEQYVASTDLQLGNVELPALVVAGGADPTLSPKAATALAAGMPEARVRIHDDYDHFCHFRHARGVAAQVADFVDAARATTRTVGLR